ncbi:hypothetical protein EV356DRAFT_569441 [Viridothelium virens]|uniref:EthD domain-containing protein n=1 Tax=Viridothelium virens TaxID=1048519 RepID=A0A6A6H0Z7_VIRVR|nr:hypothetical protein EV356DRAFT_569441 [Viridothelium virens]
MTTTQRMVRFTILIHRAPGMTEEEFSAYWDKHIAIVNDLVVRHGIHEYRQSPCRHRDESARHCSLDAVADLVAPDFEKLRTFFTDPFYKSIVSPDEPKFVDVGRLQLLVGWEDATVHANKICKVDRDTEGVRAEQPEKADSRFLFKANL